MNTSESCVNKKFIAIAGNIGSGKTTLTTLLAERYQWKPFYECVGDNPYLADFYQNMQRWSLPLQVFFLSKRFEVHKMIAEGQYSAIQDRCIYEDAHIFAKTLLDDGNMDRRDFENYQALYQNMIEHLTPPDLVVYVRRSIPILKERIEERGREYEKNIPDHYLEKLNDCYDNWIENYNLGKVLQVNADTLDLKNQVEDFDYVCKSIESSLEQSEMTFHC